MKKMIAIFVLAVGLMAIGSAEAATMLSLAPLSVTVIDTNNGHPYPLCKVGSTATCVSWFDVKSGGNLYVDITVKSSTGTVVSTDTLGPYKYVVGMTNQTLNVPFDGPAGVYSITIQYRRASDGKLFPAMTTKVKVID
ncbi:MAG: hypothetical protein ACLGPL_03520 [Acidobacteriota bacterium]